MGLEKHDHANQLREAEYLIPELKAEIRALRILLVAAILESAPDNSLNQSLKKIEAKIYEKNHPDEPKVPIKKAATNVMDGIATGDINPYHVE